VFVEVVDVVFLVVCADDDELDRVALVGLKDVVAATGVPKDPRTVERAQWATNRAKPFARLLGSVVDIVSVWMKSSVPGTTRSGRIMLWS